MGTTTTRQIWSVILSIVLVMGLNPVAAFAAVDNSPANANGAAATQNAHGGATAYEGVDSTESEAETVQMSEGGELQPRQRTPLT